MIVLDGLGDRPVLSQGYRTPLEAAVTPNMDRLSKGGLLGLIDPISPGVKPGSDVANMALLGYDPNRYYTGRGALEALGAGLVLHPGEIAFRCNFATVDHSMRVVDRRAGRIHRYTSRLSKELNRMKLESTPDLKVEFKPTVEHRAVLVFRGSGLSRMVSDPDPKAHGLKVVQSKPLEKTHEAKKTAQALNEFVRTSHEKLKHHQVNKERIERGEAPANIVLPRGPGTNPELPSFKTKFNLRASCVTGTVLIKGICRATGVQVLHVRQATGGLRTDLGAKVKSVIDSFAQSDLVFLHIKGADVASHDGDFKSKVRFLEEADGAIGKIMDEVDIAENYILVTGDHSTPVEIREHSGDPVPVAMGGPDVPSSRVTKFCEAAASRGNLGRLRGLDLMPIVTDFIGRSSKFGN